MTDIPSPRDIFRNNPDEPFWSKKENSFQVRFSINDESKHHMDLIKFSTALVGIANIINSANKLENGDDAQIQIDIQSGIKEGSVIAEIITFASGIDMVNVVPYLGFCGLAVVTDAKNVISNIIDLYHWIDNGFITRKSQKEINGHNVIEIEKNDGSVISVNNSVFNIYVNKDMNKQMQQITSVIDGKDITGIELTSKTNKPSQLTSRDYGNISAKLDALNDANHEELQNKSILWLYVTTPKTNGINYGWGFGENEGKETYTGVRIDDGEFMERVNNKEISFKKGTRIKTELLSIQSTHGDKIKTKYCIKKVLEYNTQ
jgi:hypothetical protein